MQLSNRHDSVVRPGSGIHYGHYGLKMGKRINHGNNMSETPSSVIVPAKGISCNTSYVIASDSATVLPQAVSPKQSCPLRPILKCPLLLLEGRMTKEGKNGTPATFT